MHWERFDYLTLGEDPKPPSTFYSVIMGMMASRGAWIANIFIILSMVALLGVVEMDWMPFRKIGFHCGDPKISYKFTGDTVSFAALLIITFIAPLILIFIVEMALVTEGKEQARRALVGLKQAWAWYAQFAFGLLMLILLVEVGKSLVSEPRPHFLDTCRPDKAVNCTTDRYVTDYKCTNVDVKSYYLKDSTRSFPSGHSALGYYSSVFLIWFFQTRLPDSSYLLVPWLQCICALWGMLCSLTRITDRRHHWWDVLIGSICGIAVAVYVVKTLCNGFRCKQNGEKREPSTSDDSVISSKASSRRLLSSTSSYSPPDEKDHRAL